MTQPPRVTVITPFLNAADYLTEAIASVQTQTIADWELILVDDGSTDSSRMIALEAAAKDKRIKLLNRPARSAHGAAAARNAGMKVGKGEFFAFLDADDSFEPIMLQTVLAAAKANPAAPFIFGPTKWWYPDGQRPDWIETTDSLADHLHPPPGILRRIILLQDGHVPCTCSVLVHRHAIEAVGGFEERFGLYEDQTLWAKLLLRYPVYITPVCLARYRQHPGSVSTVAAEHGLYDRMSEHPARKAFLDWLSDYVNKSGGKDQHLNRSIRLARSPYVNPPTIVSRADRLNLKATMWLAKYRRRFARKFRVITHAITGAVNS